MKKSDSMELDEFSKQLTDTINGAVKGGIPVAFVCYALDNTKFQLQLQNHILTQQQQAKDLAKDMAEQKGKFEPKIVFPDEVKK